MNASNAKEYLPLVKALADGKIIQGKMQNGKWKDLAELDFGRPAKEYRLAPKPQEFWANRYPDGTIGPALYESQQDAKRCSPRGGKQVCYREILE